MAQKNTKEHIMKIATDIFAHKGYTATSTREITSKAGVNLSMIAYYFGSKEGLFKAIIEESFKPILNSYSITHKMSVAVCFWQNLFLVLFLNLWLKIIVSRFLHLSKALLKKALHKGFLERI